jgi:glycosyltransferase involved in cell wall biosynthesis
MKIITVFTPTYNRAYCLGQVYNSLLNQTNKDFKWLIIDDGSTDDTRELVGTWIKEHKIGIEYIYQENQGMHGAHNTAYKYINTELNICIDSDDYMPDDAIAFILEKWKEVRDQQNLAGIVGLDIDKKGNVIGTKMPEDLFSTTLSRLYQIHLVKGDKKLVYRSDITNKYPEYPLFNGENFVPLDYKYLLIDQDYELAILNKPLVVVEYQQDGSTKNILQQYRRNPRGFAFSRLSRIKYGLTFQERSKNMIHLISSAIFSKDFSLIKKHIGILFFLCFPFGVFLNFFIRFKTKKV